jgi:hypothetical protein
MSDLVLTDAPALSRPRPFSGTRSMRCVLGLLPVWAVLLTWLIGSTESLAQQSDGGFKNKAPGQASGNERQSQTNLWVLEVHFKSLRIVRVKLPDAKSDEPEVILYLVYKVINRGIDEAKPESDETPVNQFDPEVTPPLFVPELTLVTNDNGVQKIYDDSLIPLAQKTVLATREHRMASRCGGASIRPPISSRS